MRTTPDAPKLSALGGSVTERTDINAIPITWGHGTAVYYDAKSAEAFRYSHAWVRVGEEVIDGNVNSLVPKSGNSEATPSFSLGRPITEVPEGRRLRKNYGVSPLPDVDVDGIWWPELKTWIYTELLGLNFRQNRRDRRQRMSNRDDFPKRTREYVAMRAGWHCSFTGCARLTVGPSEESLEAVTMIGKAAHICGAAPGPGSRRYDASMTPEQRAHIDNAIWLCADHADLIDRDEVTYTVETLHAMKREHEASISLAMRSRTTYDLGAGLLALGSRMICTGDIQNIAAASWTLRLRHFVAGDVHELVSFIDGFTKADQENRYVLSNELGDGRVLLGAPSLTKNNDGYTLLCPIAPSFPRVDVQDLGSSFAHHPETDDWYADGKGNLARISGLEYLPQKIQSLLSVQRDESVFDPTFGMRFFEYFEAFKGTPWLALLLKLDVVRQAAIPYSDSMLHRQDTPLRCVTRVNSLELLAETPTENRLPVRLDLEVQGVGRWQRDLSVYLPTKEQMEKRAQLMART